jgi:hypothetical protein
MGGLLELILLELWLFYSITSALSDQRSLESYGFNAPSSGKRERFGAAREWFSVDLACYIYLLL